MADANVDTAATNPILQPVVTVVLFAVFLLFFILHRYAAHRAGAKGRLPPGPRPWPLVGNIIAMLSHKPYFRWMLKISAGKDITCVRLGGVHLILVNNPEIGREFLVKHDAVFSTRPLTVGSRYNSRNYLSIGAVPRGDHWTKMRRVVVTEVISTVKQRPQEILRHQEADHFTKYIYNMSLAGATVDLRTALRYYAGNVMRRMLFGVRHFDDGHREFGGPSEKEVEHIEATFTLLSRIYTFRPSDFFPWLRFLDMDGHEKDLKEASKVLDKYHDPIIDERLEKWKAWRESDNNGGEGTLKMEKEDALDAFLALKDGNGKPLLDREEIRAQTAELISATVDNPSNAIEWAMAELLNQPEILRKAVEELDRVVGKDRLVQESDFPQLPYVKACAREALRLHPVAPFNLPHKSTADATVAGYFIPKGSCAMLSRIGLGRNPAVWDDPLRYDPERHLKDGFTDVELAEPNLRFISFTAGRRGCVGGALGTLMTFMLLARLLQAFDWSLPDGVATVDLAEEKGSLFKGQRMRARARPRVDERLLANL